MARPEGAREQWQLTVLQHSSVSQLGVVGNVQGKTSRVSAIKLSSTAAGHSRQWHQDVPACLPGCLCPLAGPVLTAWPLLWELLVLQRHAYYAVQLQRTRTCTPARLVNSARCTRLSGSIGRSCAGGFAFALDAAGAAAGGAASAESCPTAPVLLVCGACADCDADAEAWPLVAGLLAEGSGGSCGSAAGAAAAAAGAAAPAGTWPCNSSCSVRV